MQDLLTHDVMCHNAVCARSALSTVLQKTNTLNYQHRATHEQQSHSLGTDEHT